MSKITSKNLHYRTSPPPFLAKLKAAHVAQDGRSDVQIRRPKKPLDEEEEGEDDPVIFDEGTCETLSKDEWDKRRRKEEDQNPGDDTQGREGSSGGKRGIEETIARIGLGRKRKCGKVVGEQVREQREGSLAEDLTVAKSSKLTMQKGKGKKEEGRGKKIKLSFGDSE